MSLAETQITAAAWSLLQSRTTIAPEVEAAQEDLERLGNRIAELSARIQVATYHLLVLIREFDDRGGWSGFNSCAQWLSWRTGLASGAAREKVRVARALGALPLISGAMSRGELSYSKVRALTRVATPANEEELLSFATAGSAAHVERLVRSWRRVDRLEAAEREHTRRASRTFTSYWDEDGMLVVRGRLDPETGAVFRRALDAAAERLYEMRQASTADDEEAPDAVGAAPAMRLEGAAPLEKRWADAVGLVAESALHAGLDSGTRGDRYLVTVHVDAAVLAAAEPGEEPAGMAMLEDGVDVSAGTSRRLACDCATIAVGQDRAGNVLDVGRKRRTISAALRRALAIRDRACRFPGCGVRVCEGHHVRHWADGGHTKLDNLVLLCRRHHIAVHEQGYRVELAPDGEACFFHPAGWRIPAVPALAGGTGGRDPTLVDWVAGHGVRVGARTGSATGYWGPVDYSVALEGMRAPSPPAPSSPGPSAPSSTAGRW